MSESKKTEISYISELSEYYIIKELRKKINACSIYKVQRRMNGANRNHFIIDKLKYIKLHVCNLSKQISEFVLVKDRR
jgi:hypothetical protein